MQNKVVEIIAGIFFSLMLIHPVECKAIKLSPETKISVLTCGLGDQIYSLYGHSAIRVKDPVIKLDIVFNYGVFSFNSGNFVYRFAKGQTDYMLAAERYSDFYRSYLSEKRSITEQVLDLTQNEEQNVWDFLVNNAKPENRVYRYNFFNDNCSSRIRDVFKQQTDGELIFKDKKGEGKTFRQYVTKYQKQIPWLDFSIQLVLGSPSDEIASAYNEMFLPEFLYKHFAGAKILKDGKERPFVKKQNILIKEEHHDISFLWKYSPEIFFCVLLLIILWFSFLEYKRGKKVYSIDYFLFIITGLIGFGMLWFVVFSEHPALRPNYNLLWAFPPNIIFILLWIIKKWRPCLKWYWPLLSVGLILFFIYRSKIPQSFCLSFYFIAGMLLVRSILHSLQLIEKITVNKDK
ncbi:MAG: DUF4105 domain-containing protein [Prolixibacteraceae bacterium]|nr:DUF4105 domain-containing protein [Prolixibacteraceae bacterium]